MDYKAIGCRIRQIRIQKNLTQEKLAEKANISLSFLGHIERGSRKMSIETLDAIARALNASTDHLLGCNYSMPEPYQQSLEEIKSFIEYKLSALHDCT